MGAAAVDEHVFVMGRPPMGEFLAAFLAQSADAHQVDQSALADEWRAANGHFGALERREAGVADDPGWRDLDQDVIPLAEEVTADPMFRKAHGLTATTIAMVELDRLIVSQRSVNLTYASSLIERFGKDPDPRALFRICLPGPERSPVPGGLAARNAYVFASESTDLRVLDTVVLDADQVDGLQTAGRPAGVLGVCFGFGANFLNVLEAGGRLVMNNGTHRAYALRALGVRRVPCVISHLSGMDELQILATEAVRQNAAFYLKARRPPLFKDYFDEQLRKVAAVPRRRRELRIEVSVEALDAPA